jgi:hypothetical protein
MADDRSEELNRLPLLQLLLSLALACVTALTAVLVFLAFRAVAHPERYQEQAGEALSLSLSGMAFLGGGVLLLVYGFGVSAALLLAALRIRARAGHSFCLWVAALSTFFFPFGTLLGFHAIDVLTSATAREAFGVGSPVTARPARG